MATHLVIPDVHCKPGVTNERLTWAGRLAADIQPDTIICLGDFFDFPSLSSYDKNKRSFEGRRYQADLAAGRDGLRKFNAPIEEYNKRCRKAKKAQYSPRMVMIGSNHEEGRINRVVESSPELTGTMGVEDMQYEQHGWEYVPYRMPINIDGIFYCHFFPSGVKGEPISGTNVAQSLIAKQIASCTAGHLHTLDYATRTSPDGRRVHGLCAGCYFSHSEDYAKSTEHMWWRGVIIKRNVEDGDYDPEFMSINRIEELYGD